MAAVLQKKPCSGDSERWTTVSLLFNGGTGQVTGYSSYLAQYPDIESCG